MGWCSPLRFSAAGLLRGHPPVREVKKRKNATDGCAPSGVGAVNIEQKTRAGPIRLGRVSRGLILVGWGQHGPTVLEFLKGRTEIPMKSSTSIPPSVPRILVWSSDSALPMALRGASQRATFTFCRTMARTLTLVEKTDYDAILIDASGPEWQAHACVSQILASRPYTPVLLILRRNEERLVPEMMSDGVCGFVFKPVDPLLLAAVLKRAVRQHGLRRRLHHPETGLECLAKQQAERVSERIRQLEEENRLKEELLAMLAHELRTPLSSILAWSNLLQTAELDEATRQRALELIESSAQTQARVIDDVLDLSKTANGRLRLEFCPIELAPLVRTSIELARPWAQAKSIRIEALLNVEGSTIKGNVARLQQVFGNLLSNAIKFTHEGGHVQVRAERSDDQARITVSDNGRGISPNFLPFVFQRFRQAECNSEPRCGLGMGLAIVRDLVELHGGTVRAESRGEGLGAAFTVCLPLAEHETGREPQTFKAADPVQPWEFSCNPLATIYR